MPQPAIIAARSEKLVFANQLRGLCVLAVMLVHYTIIVQYLRRDVAWVVAAPPLDTPLASVLVFYPPWLDLGKFGVAVFFLISGFVIPFSLRGTTRATFLVSRALRIYPTFWLALAAEWATVSASGAYWHIQPAFSWRHYWPNALLIDTALGLPSVDWVSWTLAIEVKFYILAACVKPWLLARRLWPIAAIAAAALALNAGIVRVPPTLAVEAMYLGFIQIGTLFYYRYRAAISRTRLAAGVLILSAVFVVNYKLSCTPADFWSPHSASFAWAVAVFAAGFAARAWFRPTKLLDAFAAISYPLYLVHAVFGFTIISFLIMAWHVPYPAAALLAAAASVLLATVLHVVVEAPSIRLGHRLRRRFSARSAAQAPPVSCPAPPGSRTSIPDTRAAAR